MVDVKCQSSRQKIISRVKNRLGFANIIHVLHQTRLRWFGYVERIEIEKPVSNCMFLEVGGQRGKGRPCKT